jgi:hypothetical protein
MTISYGTGMVPANGALMAEMNAVTRRAIIPKMVVQIYSSVPMLSILMRNAHRAKGGLSQVSVGVQGSQYVNAAWSGYSGGFTQPTVQAAAQQAAWNLSLMTIPIPLLGMESLMQSSETVIPLVKLRMADAKTVGVQFLSNALFGSNASNPLAMNGLLDVYDDGTTVAQYGGITRSGTGSFWKSNVYSTSINPTRATMVSRIMQLTKLAGGESPDFIIMSMGDWTTLLTDYMQAEQFHTTPNTRYGNDDAINAGFRALMLGNTPILADPFCQNGTAYLINSRYLALYMSEFAAWAWSGFYSLIPNNQVASTGVVITAPALVSTKPVSGMRLSNVAGAAF